jgi:predicted dehydrogenase
MPGPLLNVSILGTGMALVHLHHPSLASLPHQYKIHSVMERTPRGRAQEACGESIKVVTAIQEVVDDPEVDLVRGSRDTS